MEDKNNVGSQKEESRTDQPANEKAKDQPSSQQQKQSQGGGLTKEDLPDSTNESTGKMGSGQRQDSN